MITGFKIFATANAVMGVGGGCGALTWYLTKDSTTNLDNSSFTQIQEVSSTGSGTESEVAKRNSNTGNCKGTKLTEELTSILKQLKGESDEEDYVVVTCHDTNTKKEEDLQLLPNNWTGLFPNDFFLNGGDLIRKSSEIAFSMNTETAEVSSEDKDYVTTFSGNMIEEDSWLGKWDTNSKNIDGKSITALKVSSEEEELEDPVYLFLNESFNSH